MKFKTKLSIVSFFVLILSLININIINSKTKTNVEQYLEMIASKITKYIVNNAYVREKINYYSNDIYSIVKNNDNEIKNIVYNPGVVNDLLNSITDRVYVIFNKLESGDLKNLNIRENILLGENNYDGIVLEIPLGVIFNNYLLSSLGPRIPVKISLTGEFESFVSTDVQEYGINNAMITVNINIKVSEQITIPFISKKIEIENKIPIFMNLVNGSIPNYYISGFSRNSNIY